MKNNKKIALAVAGILSLVGLSAAHATSTATASFNASGVGSSSVVSGIAATASDIGDGNHYLTVTLTAANSTDKDYTITTSGVGSLYGAATYETGTSVVYANGTNVASGFTWSKGLTFPSSSNFASETLTVNAVSSVAGTQTITATPTNGTSGPSTITITWGAAPALTAQYSTAYIQSATTDTATTDATISAPATASSTSVAAIAVNLNSSANTGITGQGLTASVSGPGLISVSNHALTGLVASDGGCNITTGKSITVAASAGNYATYLVCVYPDGNAGSSTITITSGTYTVSKTVTFYGAATKAVATQNLYVAAAGKTLGQANGSAAEVTTAYATTYAYTAAVTDANGNAANPAAVKAVSSDTTVIVSSTCQQLASTPGSYNCDVVAASGATSGKSATVTFEAEDASGNYTVIANPLTFRIGGSTVAKEVLALDNTSYDPGATAKLSVTATDASGNPVADGTASPATWTSTKTVQGLPSAFSYYVNGVKSYTVYAPVVSGDFSVGATGDDANATALSVAATVANATSDAASLATDAANAATDAANAAAASADNATQAASDALAAVQSLTAKVTALFTKLQKEILAIAKLLKK